MKHFYISYFHISIIIDFPYISYFHISYEFISSLDYFDQRLWLGLQVYTHLLVYKWNRLYIFIYIGGRIKYKPCNSNKLYKPLYYEILELFIDNYHGALIKLRYIWNLIIFIYYHYGFIFENKMELNIFRLDQRLWLVCIVC